MRENIRDNHLIQNQQESTDKMKLDIKTVFVALSILVGYQYISNNKDSELVTVFIEPSTNVVTLSY